MKGQTLAELDAMPPGCAAAGSLPLNVKFWSKARRKLLAPPAQVYPKPCWAFALMRGL